jgi:hypothetical protein
LRNPISAASEVSQIERRISNGKYGFGVMAVVLPPAQLDPEHFGARTERHIGEARDGELYVVAEWVVVDALGGEGGEAGIDLRCDGGVAVVVVDQGASFEVLPVGVEGA